MKNLMFLPITSNICQFVEYSGGLFNGMNLYGIDFSDKLEEVCEKIVISNSMKELSVDSGLVLLTIEDDICEEETINIFKEIELAIRKGLIIKASKGSKKVLEKHGIKSNLITYVEDMDIDIDEEKCYKINTPIVCIGGVGDYIDQFKVELQCRDGVINQGVNFFQIGSSKLSDFFGMCSIPEFIWNDGIDIETKTRKFNHFIKMIEFEYSPEIIVIGLPSNLIAFNEKCGGDFGVIGFLLTATLNIDVSVLNLPDRLIDSEDLGDLTRMLDSRFGINPEIYVLSKKIIDFEETKEYGNFKFIDLDDDELEYIERCNENIVYLENNVGYILSRKIIRHLEKFGVIEFE